MALIYQSGALNTTALTVPNLYVQIVKPSTVAVSGASSSTIGIVGTASWGPVGQPVTVGGLSDYLGYFGAKQGGTTDAGLAVDIAATQGASSFIVVRVTDGTDTAAAGTLDGVAVTAAHTGTSGNAITCTVSQTSAGYSLVVAHSVLGTANYSGKTWTAIVSAVTADLSALVSLTLPSTVPDVTAGSVTLSGGTDGGTPSTSAFVGSDGTERTGMYALRGQGCAIGLLHGISDNASYTVQASFGLGEGVYMIATTQAYDTIANAVSTISASGLDSYAVKLMFGDWLWWSDDTNGTMLVSPQAFAAGILATLSPEQSSLNKALSGVVGSQKSGLNGTTTTYSTAELSALFTAGIDVICNPAPGGSYWAARSGHNSSSSATINTDSYTRMTNYLAESLADSMGTYVGDVINDTLYANIRSSILDFLSGLVSQGVLARQDGALPYSVVCDSSNNTQARTSLGYVQADVKVRYQGINEKFIVNLQGGSSVTVSTSSTSTSSAGS